MKKLIFLSSIVLLVSCASHEHVRAGADGVHRVIIRGTEKTNVEKLAMHEATSFCDERKLSPAYVSEDTKYTGSIDEKTHKTIQKVSKAATVGGGMMGVLGGTREKNAGEGIMGAGVVGSIFEDKEAYTADMKFKCI